MTMEQTMNSNMQPAKRGIKKSWIILGHRSCADTMDVQWL